MTSNPKPIVTIVKPDDTGSLIQRPTRVFVGDVELPVKSVYVDLHNGDVDLTLHPEEVRIVREAPAPAAEPEPAKPGTKGIRFKPGTKEIRFKADPRTFVMSSEGESGGPFARTHHELTFMSAAAGDDEAVTVSVTLPAPKSGTAATGCKCSYCAQRGAR